MATPGTSSKASTHGNLSAAAAAAAAPPPQPNADRVRQRLERILTEMRAEPRMAWDFSLQLLYQKIFPDMTHFLPEEEGARYRADFEREWRRLEAA
jgi:hypothetical protein